MWTSKKTIWRTRLEIIDIETGEEITKSRYERENYIITKKEKRYRTNQRKRSRNRKTKKKQERRVQPRKYRNTNKKSVRSWTTERRGNGNYKKNPYKRRNKIP